MYEKCIQSQAGKCGDKQRCFLGSPSSLRSVVKLKRAQGVITSREWSKNNNWGGVNLGMPKKIIRDHGFQDINQI